MLDQPSFVLQREIDQPLEVIEHVVCDPRLLRAGTVFEAERGKTLIRFDWSFGVTIPPFASADTSWSAPVTICTARRRTIEQLEFELNRWAASSTELLVRPRGRHPERWGSRRLGRYFRIAHAVADEMSEFLEYHALELTTIRRVGHRDRRATRPSRVVHCPPRALARAAATGAPRSGD
jgi:hypothetical protein